ncbi:MAG: hypothetical protein ACYS19_19455, partial [Planctomycetota bacterium]
AAILHFNILNMPRRDSTDKCADSLSKFGISAYNRRHSSGNRRSVKRISDRAAFEGIDKNLSCFDSNFDLGLACASA